MAKIDHRDVLFSPRFNNHSLERLPRTVCSLFSVQLVLLHKAVDSSSSTTFINTSTTDLGLDRHPHHITHRSSLVTSVGELSIPWFSQPRLLIPLLNEVFLKAWVKTGQMVYVICDTVLSCFTYFFSSQPIHPIDFILFCFPPMQASSYNNGQNQLRIQRTSLLVFVKNLPVP